MGVDAKHPLYDEHLPDWLQMRDTYRGQRIVKAAGARYLPPTSGMIADGIQNKESKGFRAYQAYISRAVFHDVVKKAVQAMVGVMHREAPVIELPAKLEVLRERATLRNESLEMLLRRINEEQLITSRLGLLGEVPTGPGAQMPLIAFYRAEDAINWDQGSSTNPELESLNLVVLNESEYERGFTASSGTFDWVFRRKYRVLVLGDALENEPQGEGIYRQGVFREDTDIGSRALQDGEVLGTEFNESALIVPLVAGAAAREIPFVFINATDVVPDPEDPVLLGISNAALTIYRGEADYRQALFMLGQDTLVVLGGDQDQEHRTGAGASINLPIGADAKFIGVNSQGVPEMRMAIASDKSDAARRAGEMIDETSRERESGEALKIRVAARTTTLTQIALAGAFGLQEILRKIARWVGANPEEVIVTPNLDFTDDQMGGQELAQIMGAKTLGAPLSMQSIHTLMKKRGMTELPLEEELKLIGQEAEDERLQPPAASTEEDGPEEDPDGEQDPEEEDAEGDE